MAIFKIKKTKKKNVDRGGMSYSPTYRSWGAMLRRCRDKNEARYGGRGISVCDEWLDFANFVRDMGERPKGTSIDRIDNSGNYCKENCRWSTTKAQANNRGDTVYVEKGGEIKPVVFAAEGMKVSSATIRKRKAYREKHGVTGKTIDLFAAALPKNMEDRGKLYSFGGKTMMLSEWAKETGIKFQTLVSRLSVPGATFEQVISTPTMAKVEASALKAIKYPYEGKEYRAAELLGLFNISRSALYRLLKDLPWEEVLKILERKHSK